MDSSTEFTALWVEEGADGQFTRRLARRKIGDLPPGEVLVRVRYSSLNYKDALSASGNRGVTRRYPHTPGIDAAGEVVESADPALQPGDAVIAMDHELGVSLPGGFGQYIRVPASYVLPLPPGLSLKDCMAYGTAGLTAAYGVARLEQCGLKPDQGEVLVTGATGGVGVFAVAMLARDGFTVVAATGKLNQAPLLKSLGAK
jgi:acrylyl-CoA reductase (NADPH)